ncbi:CaiB/BaiF CoA transferase family protein [Agromyces seonyuensis]|uniref:CoA transferase n=1 Tax=Agromyces seonyuensis TaxID=2662446 RepID=A0A6I4P1Q6_9MICO|nr:CaiB/BaiF CoA-transferase family protein [Agromyces seonyuensis]MWB97167.1 CoA transferase [Agromyces seonyuensis]
METAAATPDASARPRTSARPAAESAESDERPPLAGIRVIEFAALGPAPHAVMQLADLGADVLRIVRPGGNPYDAEAGTLLRGRTDATADLADPVDVARVRELVARADVLVEGYRPGVMERLGLGPDELRAADPRLIYARMTGWGRTGPWAGRAGHDLTYLAVTGVLHAIGPADRPVVPLNLLGDYGGGAMFLVEGVLAGLLARERTGRGRLVEAAMVDGIGQLAHQERALRAQGRWSETREANLLDGGAPFYAVYRCADGRFVAVAAVEPAFYLDLLAGLGLDADALPDRGDEASWPALRDAFAAAFAAHDRDKWMRRFDALDACVAPVLTWDESLEHPQLAGRGAFVEQGGMTAPAPAPRFGAAAPVPAAWPPARHPDLGTALAAWAEPDAAPDSTAATHSHPTTDPDRGDPR